MQLWYAHKGTRRDKNVQQKRNNTLSKSIVNSGINGSYKTCSGPFTTNYHLMKMKMKHILGRNQESTPIIPGEICGIHWYTGFNCET